MKAEEVMPDIREVPSNGPSALTAGQADSQQRSKQTAVGSASSGPQSLYQERSTSKTSLQVKLHLAVLPPYTFCVLKPVSDAEKSPMTTSSSLHTV